MQKLTAATGFAELQGKEIALIGLGVSHRPVARLLARKGMKVTIYDKKSPEELGEAAKELTAMGVAFVTGADYLQKLRFVYILRVDPVVVDDRTKSRAGKSDLCVWIFSLQKVCVISRRKSIFTEIIQPQKRRKANSSHAAFQCTLLCI